MKFCLFGKNGKMGSAVVASAGAGAFVNAPEDADVLIDFSVSDALLKNLEFALSLGKPIVIGTTGHSPENLTIMENAAKVIPIFYAPNFSKGVFLIESFCKQLAPLIKSSSIEEIHHKGKRDAPSGTAIRLANKIAKCSKITPSITSLRKGDEIGTHKISFILDCEEIEITHKGKDRELFAKGALEAAHFIANKAPLLYTLKDLVRKYEPPGTAYL